MSSESSEKSYISALDLILLEVTDFGRGTNLQEEDKMVHNDLISINSSTMINKVKSAPFL